MAKEHILVIEDEEEILELIKFNLMKEGYHVTTAKNGESALNEIRKNPPDLIILDLMLPDADGFEVCRRLKHKPDTKHIPIAMVTAKSEESDIVAGLEIGAEDYITKPFSPKVLVARIRAIFRRLGQEPIDENSVIKIRDLVIHPGRHMVQVKGKSVTLTSSEFKLLHMLASRPGWVFSRYQILDLLHGKDCPITDRSVDVQIVGLRKKLNGVSEYIETVRGVGYRFKE